MRNKVIPQHNIHNLLPRLEALGNDTDFHRKGAAAASTPTRFNDFAPTNKPVITIYLQAGHDDIDNHPDFAPALRRVLRWAAAFHFLSHSLGAGGEF